MSDSLPGPIDPQKERRLEAEIRELPQELRWHLQHVYRNRLQTLSSMVELAREEISALDAKLKELGL